ncbi:MAG: hypothetical protein ACYC5J_03815 [Chloroflexota bacterium]
MTVRSVIPSDDPPGSWDVGYLSADVIVATQSCDLEDRKVAQLEVVPTYPLVEWLAEQPHMMGELEGIRRGHSYTYYILPAWPDAPIPEARMTRIATFDQKLAMTWPELDVASRGARLGLRSPYIEHFGQALARYYMRVGLPENMPPIEWDTLNVGPDEKAKTLSVVMLASATDEGPFSEARLEATLQCKRLVGCSDILYILRLVRETNYFGVGATVEMAEESLQRRLLEKYREQLAKKQRGEKTSWLLDAFR